MSTHPLGRKSQYLLDTEALFRLIRCPPQISKFWCFRNKIDLESRKVKNSTKPWEIHQSSVAKHYAFVQILVCFWSILSKVTFLFCESENESKSKAWRTEDNKITPSRSNESSSPKAPKTCYASKKTEIWLGDRTENRANETSPKEPGTHYESKDWDSVGCTVQKRSKNKRFWSRQFVRSNKKWFGLKISSNLWNNYLQETLGIVDHSGPDSRSWNFSTSALFH